MDYIEQNQSDVMPNINGCWNLPLEAIRPMCRKSTPPAIQPCAIDRSKGDIESLQSLNLMLK